MKIYKELLGSRKYDAMEFVSRAGMPEDKVIKVVRWLLDHKKIIIDDKHLLSWKEPDLFSG